MNQLRINNGFDRLSDADLQARTSQIIADLTANFATAPGLPALTAASDHYNTALAKAIGGGTIEKAVKNQKKEELVFQHHQMIAYVVLTSAGDRTMAAQSGYTLAKATGTTRVLTMPVNLKVDNGPNPGELLLTFDKVDAANSYIYEYTAEAHTNQSEWKQFYGNRRKYLFTGMETGKRYWIQVAALGNGEQLIHSEPILSKLVQ